MKRKFLRPPMLSCAGLAIGLIALSAPGRAALLDPTGTWLTEDGRGRIRVERCGPKQEQICGYVVWTSERNDPNGQPFRDRNNPDRSMQSRPLLGHQLILGLELNPDGRFAGQIYNADNGKTYEITLWREAADKLNIKGCMLSIFCGSQTWTETVDALPGQLVGPTGSPSGPRPDPKWAQAAVAKSPLARPTK